MTVAEVAEYLGCSVREARAPWRRLMKREAEIMAEIEAEEKKRKERKERKAAAVKRPRRPPEWCLPPWERRNGAQNIAWSKAKRRRDAEPFFAWWVWTDGKPVAKSDTLEGAKALAMLRNMVYETYVWAAEDWEEEVKRNPQISEVLKAYER